MFLRQLISELSLLVVSLLLGLTSTGKIIPDKTMPITMSSTNALKSAEYNFTMKLESRAVPDCRLKIVFPEQQYIDGLGLDYGFQVFSPYDTALTGASVSGKTLSVDLGYREPLTDIVVTVKGVQNPSKVGGTGMFKSYYVCGPDDNIVDICETFATIAVTDPVKKLFSTKAMVAPGSSAIAGELSNYLINLLPTGDISANANFRITFPSYYNFTYLNNLVTDFPSVNPCQLIPDPETGYMPSGNITCKFSKVYDNVIEWSGNNATIPKKSPIWLKLVNVYNPKREMDTDFLTAEVILKNTNFTYEYDDAIQGLIILPGPINGFRLDPVLQKALVPNTVVDFYVSFTPTNSFSSMRIVTRFRAIQDCIVKNGLLPLSVNTGIKCEIISNVIQISGIQTYQRKYKINADKIKILLDDARLPYDAGTQIPFEVYTYQTDNFMIKVDQEMTSQDSVLEITSSSSLFA